MAEFLEKEAIESSGSDEEDFLETAKRKKEPKKKHYESSEDESEDGRCSACHLTASSEFALKAAD